jgi:anti-sigma B factor antagonist
MEPVMAEPAFQHIRLSRVGDVVVIELITKEIQGPTLAQELGTELKQVLAQDWAKRLVIDLYKVTYLSSSGFAAIFRVVSESRKKGIEVKLCGMDGAVELGANIVGLDKVAEIHANQQSALKAFNKV